MGLEPVDEPGGGAVLYIGPNPIHEIWGPRVLAIGMEAPSEAPQVPHCVFSKRWRRLTSFERRRGSPIIRVTEMLHQSIFQKVASHALQLSQFFFHKTVAGQGDGRLKVEGDSSIVVGVLVCSVLFSNGIRT